MDTEISPLVGNWYRHLDKGEPFQVTAVDAGGNVEIAQFDGTLDEIAAGDWPVLEIEPCEAPADWTAPLDRMDPEQPGFLASDTTGGDWRAPVEEEPALVSPPAQQAGGAPPGADPQDDAGEELAGTLAPSPAQPIGAGAGAGAERSAGAAPIPSQAELAEAREAAAELLGALGLREYVFELRLREEAPEVRVEHAAPKGWACVSLPADTARLRSARRDPQVRRAVLESWRERLGR